MSPSACCGDPRPRISEKTGRVFCASCRQYLDRPQQPSEPLRDPDDEKASDTAAAEKESLS